MIGIWASQGGSSLNTSISNNVVANLTQTNAVNAVDQTVGILAQSGQYTIQSDSVYNLVANCVTSVSQGTTGEYGSIVGISQQGIGSAVQTISNNLVFNLYSIQTSTSANAIYGISLNGVASTSYRHIANANLVYNLYFPNAATGSLIYGIYIRSGIFLLSNNIVDLGIRYDGSTITGNNTIAGIYGGFNTGGITTAAFPEQFYHNSVAIVGTSVTSGTSYCFIRNNSSSPKDFVDVRNNIFYNNRSGGTANFSIWYDSNSNLSTSTEDWNDYYGAGPVMS